MPRGSSLAQSRSSKLMKRLYSLAEAQKGSASRRSCPQKQQQTASDVIEEPKMGPPCFGSVRPLARPSWDSSEHTLPRGSTAASTQFTQIDSALWHSPLPPISALAALRIPVIAHLDNVWIRATQLDLDTSQMVTDTHNALRKLSNNRRTLWLAASRAYRAGAASA